MKYFSSVGFKVLTLLTLKSAIFWDVTLCNPAEVILVLADYFELDGCLADSST
jgi:hypothetical protein